MGLLQSAGAGAACAQYANACCNIEARREPRATSLQHQPTRHCVRIVTAREQRQFARRVLYFITRPN